MPRRNIHAEDRRMNTLFAIALATTTTCGVVDSWEPDTTRPIPVNMIGMNWDEMQVVVNAAERWNVACGRKVFDMRAPAYSEPDAVNVTIEPTDDGSSRQRETSDRGEIQFATVPMLELAVHELGHVLIGAEYDGDIHSVERGSVMQEMVDPGYAITETDARLGCEQEVADAGK
jgi:hypothetical protein